MKKCKQCGNEFRTGHGGRKIFCSKKCGVKWWNDYYSRKKVRDAKCIVCGKPLPKRRHNYCSDKCRIYNANTSAKKQYKKYQSDAFIDVCLNCTQAHCDGECNIINQLIGADE